MVGECWLVNLTEMINEREAVRMVLGLVVYNLQPIEYLKIPWLIIILRIQMIIWG